MILPKGLKLDTNSRKEDYQWCIYINNDSLNIPGYNYSHGTILVAKDLSGKLLFYDDIIHLFDRKELEKYSIREEKLKRILKTNE